MTIDLTRRPISDWLEAYRRMERVRRFETKAVELFRAGELPGFIHPSVGQEATSVGMTFDLGPDDSITSTHRGHGHVISKGAALDRMFAELYGKETGFCRGRGGSMHIIDPAHGILGANGIVGAGIPIAVGAALASSLDGTDRVTVCFFGDGAVNTGAFHEALNMAGLWRLPVVFVCENNQYAESTAFRDVIPTADLRPRAASYGMPGEVIDGNDISVCLATAGAAVARAREGEGPTLVQADTYRWYGHHTGDVAPYRTAEELAEWKGRDPIERLTRALTDAGEAPEALEAVGAEIDAEIEEAVAFARRSPDPAPDTVLESVYSAPAGGAR